MSNVSGENAIGAVKMAGSKSPRSTLDECEHRRAGRCSHPQSELYLYHGSERSDIGTIDVDGATHTAMTLEIYGGTVETVDLSA